VYGNLTVKAYAVEFVSNAGGLGLSLLTKGWYSSQIDCTARLDESGGWRRGGKSLTGEYNREKMDEAD
jgi:hypothetical protein